MQQMSFLVFKFILLFLLLSNFHVKTVNATDKLWEACLSDLSLSELIRLDKSLEYVPNNMGYSYLEDKKVKMEQKLEKPEPSTTDNKTKEVRTDEQKPTALAMTAEKREYANHHSAPVQPHPHPHPWAVEKPSKLQTLFQISITALSFLAFGGYLLCLIVQAIKSKGSTYLYPMMDGTSLNGNIKRIRVYRRNGGHQNHSTQR